MINLIKEDLLTQREGILAQGFWALLVYRLSHRRMNCRIPVIRQLWYIVNRLSGKLIEVMTGIMLPEGAVVGRRLQIEHFGSIIIHGNAVLGDDCLIRQGVTIGNRGSDENGSPIIGDRVQIGAGAILIGSIHVGNDAVIGANAVVTKNVPPAHIAVGVPARVRPRQLTRA